MHADTFRKAAIMVLSLTTILIGGYEYYLRHLGHTISFDDSESLFADKKRKIYLPIDEATVFTGSSRMKYDLNTSVWRQLTGETPIQLANVGSSPIPILKALAADTMFKGKLIMDVTEGLFFDMSGRGFRRPQKCLDFSKNETPAQRFSFHLNTFLESGLVFLDKDNFALSALLEHLPIPPRPGKMDFPKYPTEFELMNFDRQNMMTDRFVDTDTAGVKMMQDIWLQIAKMGDKAPPTPVHVIDSFLLDVKKHTDLITARGGKVFFLRPTSSGPLWQGEQMGFPRDKFWEKLLTVTGSQGMHFEDYPELKKMQCTEFSHLRQSDGIIYTKKVVEVLSKDIGWKFKSLN
ncbi:MAG: hypothetical protein IPN29_21910 [Saprospiraceae bacterium]|nr:hypothetical protein [Saprospiraceae bacterium]